MFVLFNIMVKSELCQRIELCGSIQTLNKDGCCAVIRLLFDILDYNSLNRLLTTIISNTNGVVSYNDLQTFEKEFYNLLSSSNSQYVVQKQQSHSTTTVTSDTLNNTEKQLFPLLRLSIDLVTKTSLYLNQYDIFEFEQCCRLFYTMINNTTYLKQSNTYNTFTIGNTLFKKLAQSQYSFFKYSKATRLEFDISAHYVGVGITQSSLMNFLRTFTINGIKSKKIAQTMVYLTIYLVQSNHYHLMMEWHYLVKCH